MVALDYRFSPEWNERIDRIDLRTADRASLAYDLFLGDISMRLDGADFSAPWGWVPVLDFCASLVTILVGLSDGAEGRFEFTESEAAIEFARQGDTVEVTSNYANATAHVSYAELLAEVLTFARRVLDELTTAYPALCENAVIQAFKSNWSVQ